MKKILRKISRLIMLLTACACSRLPQSASPDVQRIVFMGNSITQHWPDYDPEFWEVEGRINKGISGQVTAQMLERFQRDVVEENADVVFILGGTNDVAGNMGPVTVQEVFGNIIEMTEIAEGNGITVALTSVLPVADYPWNAGQGPLDSIPKLNGLVEEYAVENGIIYVDYYAEMVNENGGMTENYAYDGVHPNSEGYAVMRAITLRAIDNLKVKRKR